ncbi:MAG: tetratricopeptide repeat protein [Flavobacterium sp.]|nr:MAG: tetratricopeptide repeat protein [Flavobacterium sp.]
MKNNYKLFSSYLILLLFVLCTRSVYAQNDARQLYNNAENLANKANAELLIGNVLASDSLIKKSLEIYPTNSFLNYALSIGKMPNMHGANLLMDLFMSRLDKLPETVYYKLYTHSPVLPHENNQAKFFYLRRIYHLNNMLGERKWMLKNLRNLAEFEPSIPAKDPMFKAELKLRQSFKENLELELKMGSPTTTDSKINKHDLNKGNEEIYRFKLGLAELEKGNYDTALKYFQQLLNVKAKYHIDSIAYTPIEKWGLYKAIGDTYNRLNNYEKAKDNYTISLYYNPEYKSSIERE